MARTEILNGFGQFVANIFLQGEVNSTAEEQMAYTGLYNGIFDRTAAAEKELYLLRQPKILGEPGAKWVPNIYRSVRNTTGLEIVSFCACPFKDHTEYILRIMNLASGELVDPTQDELGSIFDRRYRNKKQYTLTTYKYHSGEDIYAEREVKTGSKIKTVPLIIPQTPPVDSQGMSTCRELLSVAKTALELFSEVLEQFAPVQQEPVVTPVTVES